MSHPFEIHHKCVDCDRTTPASAWDFDGDFTGDHWQGTSVCPACGSTDNDPCPAEIKTYPEADE